MRRHHAEWDTPLFLSLLVWLCTLPLVGLLVLPTFGIEMAAAVAAMLLLLALLICWTLCWWPAAQSDDTH